MKFWKRWNEPSTWAGAAAISLAASQSGIFEQGGQVAQVAAETGNQFSQGNQLGAILTAVFGVLAIFKREKGPQADDGPAFGIR